MINRLAFALDAIHRSDMGQTGRNITLTPEQVEDLSRRLAALRHNANNHLATMVAALEVIRTKPDAAKRLVAGLLEQPPKILDEVRAFSADFETALKIKRG